MLRTAFDKPYAELRLLTAGLFAYETVAILLDRDHLPTFSRLAGRHRWVGPALVGALAVHLYWPVSK